MKPSKLEKQIKFMKERYKYFTHLLLYMMNLIKISFRKANNIDFDNLLKSCDIGLLIIKKILKDNLFVNLRLRKIMFFGLNYHKKVIGFML